MNKNKLLALIIIISLILPLVSILPTAAFSGGEGTPENPYKIATVADLNEIRNNMLGYYIQTADIIFNPGETFEPIGVEWDAFMGNYNGNGYKIKNLSINSSMPQVGLFGSIYNANISNVAIENISITANADENFIIGGLVGHSYMGIISKCYVTGTIDYAKSDIEYYCELGGLIGSNNVGSVVDSYSDVTLTTDMISAMTGGFVGANNGIISNCYSVGRVSAVAPIPSTGGFTGSSFMEKLENCYYDIETTGAEDVRTRGYTTDEMQNIENYIDWDFENTWQFVVGKTYPQLIYYVNFLGGTVYKDIMTLSYSENLEYDTLPLTTDFIVYVTRESVNVKSVEIKNNTIILILENEVQVGDDVYFEYDLSGCNITSIAGDKKINAKTIQDVRNITYSNNANLKSLTLDKATLNEEFEPNKTSYTATADNDITTITILPEVDEPGSHWFLTNAQNEPIENADINLRLGINTFKITVFSESGDSKTYTLVITRKKAVVSADNSKLTFEYTRFLDEPEFVTIDTTSIIPGTKYHVGKTADWIVASPDMDYTDGFISIGVDTRFLSAGKYTGNVTIYDGNIETVTIPIELNVYNCNIAQIDNISVENVDLELNGDTYYGIVTDEMQYISINADTMYNGTTEGLGVRNISNANNRFSILVTAEDGITERLYYIEIYRKSTNANLKSIIIPKGIINEEFAPNITNYTANVPYEVTIAEIISEAEYEKSITFLKNEQDEPLESNKVSLQLGENTFKISVFSEVGGEKIYTIVITRNEATILADNTKLTFDYIRFLDNPEPITIDVTASIGAIQYHVGKTEDWIVVTPDMDYTDGIISIGVDAGFLSVGKYEGNVTISDSNITITIPIELNVLNCNVAEIDNISVLDVDLELENKIYYGMVSDEIQDIAIKSDAKFNGEVINAESYPLSYGDNSITITIISEDGKTTKHQEVIIYRNYPPLIEELEVIGGTLLPDFDSDIDEYLFTSTDKKGFSINPAGFDEYNKVLFDGDVRIEYEKGFEGDHDKIKNTYITGKNLIIRVVNSNTGKEKTYTITIEGWNFSARRGTVTTTGGSSAPKIEFKTGLPYVLKTGEEYWFYKYFSKLSNGKELINWTYSIEFSDPNVLTKKGDMIVAKAAGICNITVTDTATKQKINVSVMVPDKTITDSDATFTDITDHWAKFEIERIAKLGLMQGVGNSLFAPEDVVTAEEVITVLDRYLVDNSEAKFTNRTANLDIKTSDWSEFYIKDFVARLGTEKLQFAFGNDLDFTQKIKREQVAYLLAVVLYPSEKLKDVKAQDTGYIDNLYMGNKFAPHVQLLKEKGMMIGNKFNAFSPQDTLTRAEMATLLGRIK